MEQFLEVTLIWKKNSVQIGVSFHILLHFCVYIYSLYMYNCIHSYMYSFILSMTRKFCLMSCMLSFCLYVYICVCINMHTHMYKYIYSIRKLGFPVLIKYTEYV